MSEENVQLLLRGFALWNQGEFEATTDLMDPDIEWRPGRIFPDVDEVYYGHEGVRRFWRDFLEPWEAISAEPEQITAGGDEVVVRSRFRARGRDGIEVDVTFGERYTFREGVLVRFQTHTSHEEALAAAGLSGQAPRPGPPAA